MMDLQMPAEKQALLPAVEGVRGRCIAGPGGRPLVFPGGTLKNIFLHTTHATMIISREPAAQGIDLISGTWPEVLFLTRGVQDLVRG